MITGLPSSSPTGDSSKKKSIEEILAETRAKKIAAKAKEDPSFAQNVGDFIANAGAQGVSKVTEGFGNLLKMTDYINPVSYLQKAMGEGDKTFGAQSQKGAEFLAKQPVEVQQKLGTDQSTGGKLGETTGKVLGTVAAQVPALAAGGELLAGIKALPAFQKIASATPEAAAKIADFITKSAGTTAIIKGTSEGELPTLTDLGVGGAVDALTLGIGAVGKSLYKSAFRGGKNVEKGLMDAFGKTAADVAETKGYTGTETQIINKAQEANKPIWQKIVDLSKTNKPVTRKQFIDTVLPPLLKEADSLPDSVAKDQIVKIITSEVEKYAPKTSATGEELIGIIGNLNKGLFGEGAKTVLTPKQLASITQELKVGIKDLLPVEIKPLYQEYSANKIIENVMKDERVKRYLQRAGAGTTIGAIAGASSSQGDFWTKVKGGLTGAIIGALAGGTTGHTAVSTVGGKFLKESNKTPINVLTRNIINKFLESM